jgi:hypothetical protein
LGDRTQSDKQVWKFWLRLGIILLMALAALLASVAFGEPGASLEPSHKGSPSPNMDRPIWDAKLTLRVYNYAQIDPVSLARSEKVATAIFENVGAELVWLDCPLSQAQFRKYPACQSDLGRADLVLRILPRRMAVKLIASDEPLGFGQPCPSSESACELSVFSDAVDQLATEGYREDLILGHVIAHEMAHVLIGAGHSQEGIMRGVWCSRDLQRISWGMLLDFTGDQARQLRAAAAERTKSR